MNIFGLDIEQLDLDEAREILSGFPIDRLPGVPAFLTKEDCALVLGISIKVVNYLIDSGQLPYKEIPSDTSPCNDLFGQVITNEKYVLRADLIEFMESSLLCNKPVL